MCAHILPVCRSDKQAQGQSSPARVLGTKQDSRLGSLYPMSHLADTVYIFMTLSMYLYIYNSCC